ncbi:MAG: ModE family transcriptional regulator [Bacteroidia bacterium]|nr:MAG: ModE family transcriptional regulator [Bacteroidia bacterium]
MKKQKTEIFVRIWINKHGKPFLGDGRIELLQMIKKRGSIRSAAHELKMSYKKAWGLVDSMNNQAIQPLVQMKTGGKSGGGAVLTKYGESIVQQYSKLQNSLQKRANQFINSFEL